MASSSAFLAQREPPPPAALLGLGAAVVLGALTAVVAYATSPIVAIALPLGLVVAVGVLIAPIAGIVLALLAVPLEHLNVRVGAGGLSAGELLFVLSAGSVLLAWIRGERARVEPVHAVFGVFILVVAAGIAFAPDTTVPFKQSVMWSAFLILSIYVAQQPLERVAWLLAAIAIGAGLEAGVALASGKQIVIEQAGATAANRATASFTHPNILGFFFVLTLPVAVVTALRMRGWLRLPFASAVILILLALGLTLSRGAIIGAAVALLALLAWTPVRRVIAVLAVALVVLTAVHADPLVGATQVRDLGERLSTVSGESRTNPRLRIYRKAPELLTTRPLLGIGEGNFYLYSSRFGLYDLGGEVFEHAHNTLLTVGVETGFVGLAVFLTFVATVAGRAIVALRARHPPSFPIALAVTAALGGLAVNSMTDYWLNVNYVMALVLLEIGALVACVRAAATDVVPATGALQRP